MKYVPIILISLGIASCSNTGGSLIKTRSDQAAFIVLKKEQVQEIARHIDFTLPPSVDHFFAAASKGEFKMVSEVVAAGPEIMFGDLRDFQNTHRLLWYPILEVGEACRIFKGSDVNILRSYANELLLSMPKGSIYLVATELDSFGVNMVNETRAHQRVYLIAPYGLPVYAYLDYLHMQHWQDVWIPSRSDADFAFTNMARDVHSGAAPPSVLTTQTNSGWILPSDRGMIWLSSYLLRDVLARNSLSHEVYIDGKARMPWMLPYLEPHGLTMKVNKDAIPSLSDVTIKRDIDFWDKYVSELVVKKEFIDSVSARRTFCRMRAAFADVYVYRRLYSEAERTLAQALRLLPADGDVSCRLAEVYMDEERFDEAGILLAGIRDSNPDDLQVDQCLKTLQVAREVLSRRKQLEAHAGQGKMEIGDALELADIYRRLGKEAQFEMMIEAITSDPIPEQYFKRLADICKSASRSDLLLFCWKAYADKNGTEKIGLSHLAASYLIAQQPDKALEILRRAVEANGDPMRDILRQDERFDSVRDKEEFKKLLAAPQGRQ